MIKILYLLIAVGVIVLMIYSPSIDITSEGDVLLWYNDTGERKFKKLWKIN